MKKKLITASAILLVFTGCITVNVPLGGGETGPSYLWQLQWVSPVQHGDVTILNSLRIKDFDAAGNYQLSGMVVRHSDGTVSESSNNRWASRPGAMLSEMLSRDLLIAGSYPAIFRTATSVNNLLTVEGYVREFGATQIDSTTWVAIMDVDVTLLSSGGSAILMQKNYRYERRMPATGFKTLTEQLSVLGSIWSEAVITDMESVLLPGR
jgi:uncharacterized lipoprotein YmbA